ncbi:hypothetical protein ABTJ67_20940, partial [Acinetobacter baumannii]
MAWRIGARMVGASLGLAMASPVIARTQAFVLMAPDGGAVARAITDGGACPALHIDGHAKP